MTIWDRIIEGVMVFVCGWICCCDRVFFAMAPSKCEAIAHRMGIQHEFTYIGGCMVEARHGVWVPLSSYRAEGGK